MIAIKSVCCRCIFVFLVIVTTLATAKQIASAADLPIYTDSLSTDWQDYWSWKTTRNLAASSPVHSGSKSISVTVTEGWGALYLHSEASINLSGYEKLRFWIHGGNTGNQHIRIVANGDDSASFSVTPVANSWTQVDIPLASLGSPAALGELYWQDTSGAAQPVFYLDDVILVAGSSTPPPPGTGPAIRIDASGGSHAINPDIYGMNFADEALANDLRLPVRRRGGNSTSRYNWQNDTYNTGSDWYFENVPEQNSNTGILPIGSAADRFVEQDRRTGTKSLLTIPLIGWVAKERKASHPYDCGFSIKKYGLQTGNDWEWDSDCGNGLTGNGPINGNDPGDTSVAVSEEYVTAWISHLIGRFGTADTGGVNYYNLDNEPMLWNSTHRDIHPQPVTYDEIRDRTYLYAPAIKAADPSAKTLGPVLWGWCAYFYSAKDDCGDRTDDFQAHGNTYFVPWYLQQMKSYEQLHGMRILDYLDLHFYPQGSGVSLTTAGNSATQALRLRSTRALWDPTYLDESWIGTDAHEKVRLIPRMKEWVNGNYPGTKLAITEYNWGGLESINGALAQADILGIFGREGLDLATLWAPPASDQPGAFAFRIFRNYDGSGHGFGETSISAASADQDSLAAYAALRVSDGALTVVMINKSAVSLTSSISFTGYPLPSTASVYRYSTANLTVIEKLSDQPLSSGAFSATFPPYSITLYEIVLNKMPLTVSATGSGIGTITSIPSGISCQSGSSSGCSSNFTYGRTVELQTTASTGSAFSMWGGDCSAAATCKVVLDGAKNVSGAFALAPNVRIGSTSYTTLQEAYNASKTSDSINLKEGTQDAALLADRNIDITIRGGFDAAFPPVNQSYSTLIGGISLKLGTVRMERVRIR